MQCGGQQIACELTGIVLEQRWQCLENFKLDVKTYNILNRDVGRSKKGSFGPTQGGAFSENV